MAPGVLDGQGGHEPLEGPDVADQLLSRRVDEDEIERREPVERGVAGRRLVTERGRLESPDPADIGIARRLDIDVDVVGFDREPVVLGSDALGRRAVRAPREPLGVEARTTGEAEIDPHLGARACHPVPALRHRSDVQPRRAPRPPPRCSYLDRLISRVAGFCEGHRLVRHVPSLDRQRLGVPVQRRRQVIGDEPPQPTFEKDALVMHGETPLLARRRAVTPSRASHLWCLPRERKAARQRRFPDPAVQAIDPRRRPLV